MGKEVDSSKELLSRFQFKREKGSIVEVTREPMIVSNGQFNLSNYQVGCQNNNTFASSAGQCESNKTPIQAINDSKANIQAITRSFIQVCAKN